MQEHSAPLEAQMDDTVGGGKGPMSENQGSTVSEVPTPTSSEDPRPTLSVSTDKTHSSTPTDSEGVTDREVDHRHRRSQEAVTGVHRWENSVNFVDDRQD